MKNNKFFHTQEKRNKVLKEPIPCYEDNAWLGDAIYFWYDEENAIFWGNKSKKRTGEYSVYIAIIDSENVLDTVFNEDHYYNWVTWIEKAAAIFIKKTGNKPNLKEINEYLKDRKVLEDVSGVSFQDISENPEHYLVNKFQYKKRIQLAVYNKNIINKFEHHFDMKCL